VKCPYCAHLGDKVVDSRESKEGEVIRRRRECLECGRRFTSYERIEEIPYMVIKKDGTRERFERQKLVAGLLKACEKRPVSVAAIDAVADRVESMLQERPEKEIPTADIGAFVMEELKHLDKVAYVRFASVYRHFRDIGEFMNELKDLLKARECCAAYPSSSCSPAWCRWPLRRRRRSRQARNRSASCPCRVTDRSTCPSSWRAV
jgi:transcriptional repressor NrdR